MGFRMTSRRWCSSLLPMHGLELLKRAWIEALELAMRQLAALLHSKYTVRI